MSRRRVLVTGATGMVGRFVVPRLLEMGYSVTCLVRGKHSLETFSWARHVVSIRGDLLDVDVCGRAVQGVHRIIHLAGLAHTRRQNASFFEVNTTGTQNLVSAALRADVDHFVFMSTIAVYGRSGVVTESTACCPRTAYGQSKLAAEEIVQRAADSSNMTFTILRPSVIFGEHDRGNVLRMIKAIDRGLFVLIDGGRALKSMTHVENVVDIVMLALEDNRARNEIFNVSDVEPYSLARVAGLVSNSLNRSPRLLRIPRNLLRVPLRLMSVGFGLLGKTPPVTWEDVEVLTSDNVANVQKLASQLNYRSRVSLEEGIQRVVRWYKNDIIVKRKK